MNENEEIKFIKRNSFAVCLCIGFLFGFILKHPVIGSSLGCAIRLELDRRLKVK